MHFINYKRESSFKVISYEKITGYNNKKEGVRCMVCNHYYFKDTFNDQPYVCNKCHDFSTTVMDLSDFFILNIKNNDYRVYINNTDKKEAMIIFIKSNLDDKGVLSMDFKTLSKPLVFKPNITPVDVTKNQRRIWWKHFLEKNK